MNQPAILQKLTEVLGYYRKSTQTESHSNYAFKCPFCVHEKMKLEIDLMSQNWHCWVCNSKGKTIYGLLKKINAPKYLILEFSKIPISPENLSRVAQTDSRLSLPNEFIPLTKDSNSHFRKIALDYIKKRGLTEIDIRRYRIGYCEEGKERGKIIVPNFDSIGKLNYWIGRSFNPLTIQKFSSPSVSKNIVGFEWLISWNHPIVICEGAFDAIAIRRNAIPLFGKTLSERLKSEIIQNRPPKVLVALDADAIKSSYEILEYFTNNGIETFRVPIYHSDPSKLGFSAFWKVADKAVKIRQQDLFEFGMHAALNNI